MHVKPNTESGIKPDIVLADGTRLRSLPWGGRQCGGCGIRQFPGGYEVVDLHPGTLEPFPETSTYRFVELVDAAAWAIYRTNIVRAFFFDDEPEPVAPAVKPIEPAPVPSAIAPKRTNRNARLSVTLGP